MAVRIGFGVAALARAASGFLDDESLFARAGRAVCSHPEAGGLFVARSTVPAPTKRIGDLDLNDAPERGARLPMGHRCLLDADDAASEWAAMRPAVDPPHGGTDEHLWLEDRASGLVARVLHLHHGALTGDGDKSHAFCADNEPWDLYLATVRAGAVLAAYPGEIVVVPGGGGAPPPPGRGYPAFRARLPRLGPLKGRCSQSSWEPSGTVWRRKC